MVQRRKNNKPVNTEQGKMKTYKMVILEEVIKDGVRVRQIIIVMDKDSHKDFKELSYENGSLEIAANQYDD